MAICRAKWSIFSAFSERDSHIKDPISRVTVKISSPCDGLGMKDGLKKTTVCLKKPDRYDQYDITPQVHNIY